MDCPSAIPVKLRVPPTLLERVPVSANADSAYTDVVERNIIFDPAELRRCTLSQVVSPAISARERTNADAVIDRLRFDEPHSDPGAELGCHSSLGPPRRRCASAVTRHRRRADNDQLCCARIATAAVVSQLRVNIV